MKRIKFVFPKISNPKTGGQKYDVYLIQKLTELHHDVTFITDENLRYKPSVAFFYNIVYFFSLKSFLKTEILITNSRMYPRLYLFIKLLKILKKDIKLIVVHHHYNYSVKSGFKKTFHKFIECSFLNNFNSIIIPSNYVREQTKLLFPNKDISFLEIAFKTHPHPIVEKQYNNNLLYIGTIEHRKGIHLLIDALKEINKDYILHLVGQFNPEDPYYLLLKSKIEGYKLKDKIQFCGRLSNDKMEKHLTNASVFVFPSLHEGYGMVMVEAMAYGLPVIAFNNSAMPYIIKNQYNGLLVKDKNVDDLMNKITLLLTNDQLLKELSKNAKFTFNAIRKFDNLDQDIEHFYKKLVYEN